MQKGSNNIIPFLKTTEKWPSVCIFGLDECIYIKFVHNYRA